MKSAAIQFVKFSLVGGFCTLLNIALLFVLTGLIGFHYIVSCIILFFLINFLGYQLNRFFTFADSGVEENFSMVALDLVGLFKYNAVLLCSLFLVILQMYFLVDIIGMWYIYANILTSASMMFFNFFSQKKITFLK